MRMPGRGREAPVVRRAAVIGSVGMLFIAGCYGGGGPRRTVDGAGGPAALAGAPAVSFDIPRLGGGTDGLGRHRGSVVLMNFWATWCPPCKDEMPALERLYRELRGRGLVVLGIDQGEAAGAVAPFVRHLGITFPILLDADQQYASSYISVGLPTSVIVGRDGRVVRGIDGAQTLGQFRSAVLPALAKS